MFLVDELSDVDKHSSGIFIRWVTVSKDARADYPRLTECDPGRLQMA